MNKTMLVLSVYAIVANSIAAIVSWRNPSTPVALSIWFAVAALLLLVSTVNYYASKRVGS